MDAMKDPCSPLLDGLLDGPLVGLQRCRERVMQSCIEPMVGCVGGIHGWMHRGQD